MKRFLSVILSLLLILSCASFSFAEEAAAPLSAEEISAMIEDGTLDLNLVTLRDFYTKTTAVSIGDRSISPALLNYSYITQYYSFLTQYGAYAANFGLNTSLGVTSLMGQACPMLNGGTWMDYFLSAAIDSLLMNTALSRYAEENGVGAFAIKPNGLSIWEDLASDLPPESGGSCAYVPFGAGWTFLPGRLFPGLFLLLPAVRSGRISC